MKNNFQLESLRQTELLAKTISKIANQNIYLLLNGPLAAGKTQLTNLLANN